MLRKLHHISSNIMNDLGIFLQQNWYLLLLGLIVITLILYEEKNGGSDQMRLTPDKAVSLINRESAKVVDLRDKEQFREQHIEGSLNIPTAEFSPEHKRLNHTKSKPLIFVADSKLDGMKAIAICKRHGKKDVYFMPGGLNAWRDANMPISGRSK